MRVDFLSLSVLALTLLTFSISAGAEDRPPVGHIVAVDGEVRVARPVSPDKEVLDWDHARPATMGMPIFYGESIKTGRSGTVTIQFGDGTRSHITAGSLVPVLFSAVDEPHEWKQLTDDLGVMLYTDEFGVTRGTLHVRLDDKWRPVAIDGAEEFLPDVLPLGR